MCKQIPLNEAWFYFHELTHEMIESREFPRSITRFFRRIYFQDWYGDRHLAFASFGNRHFVLLTSFYAFSLCDFSELELMKILDICQSDLCVFVGTPSEIDLNRLHKYQLKLA
jgi:hypothetical protein